MTDGTNTQYSNPEGEEGRRTLEHMNEHHARLWDFCLSHMPKVMDGSVLDIGCGGGGFIRKLSERYPYALFYGLDISEESVGMTLEVNSGLVDQGALKATVGDVCGIPYADASFDMVTAMETYFFWPDLEKGMSEAHRVLSEGGLFVIGSEMQANPGDEAFMEESLRECGCRLRYDSDIIAMMESAGFSVRTFSVPEERWVVFVGRRSERERRGIVLLQLVGLRTQDDGVQAVRPEYLLGQLHDLVLRDGIDAGQAVLQGGGLAVDHVVHAQPVEPVLGGFHVADVGTLDEPLGPVELALLDALGQELPYNGGGRLHGLDHVLLGAGHERGERGGVAVDVG